MENLNTNHHKKLEKLNFFKFMSLVITLKTVIIIYRNGTVADYYLILGLEKLHEQFVKNLFEFLYNYA